MTLTRQLSRRPDWQLLLVMVAAVVLLKAALVAAMDLDLHFDEAQYWTWSQHLDWSYYSKGPLVAWLIALSESLFGHGEWQTRLFAWLANGAFAALLFLFARDVWQSRAAGWWAALLALTTPMYFILGLAMTTDIFMFLAWSAGLWCAWRALFRARPLAWYGAGLAVGLGALTKLSVGLMPFWVGLVVLVSPRLRPQLANRHLWGALLLMLAVMSPMLLWNAGHDWVMLKHEAGHVDHEGWSLARIAEHLAGQWLALSPLVALVALTVLWRPPRSSEQRLLWLVAAGCIAFFAFKAASAKVQINWPAPSYISLLVLFAGMIPQLGRIRRRLLFAGLGVSIALPLVMMFPYQLGLSGRYDSFFISKGWQRPIAAIARHSDADFILTDSYKLGSELAFYWPRPIPVYVTGSAERRLNQFDLWPGPEREAGRDGLFVSTGAALPAELDDAFAQCMPLPARPAYLDDGTPLRTFHVTRCSDYRPIAWPQPQYY